MVFIKQFRTCAKHPEGIDVLIPLRLEFETVSIVRAKGYVNFYGDQSGWTLYPMTVDHYKLACASQNCVAATGEFS